MFDRIRTLTALLALTALMVAPAAHGQRIGYTNQEAILANMPGMQDVQQQLQQEAKQQQQQLQQQRQAFQKKVQQYQQQQSLLSDSAQSQREQELQQLQAELQQSSQQRQQQLRQRERELMQPLLEDLQNAIDSVSAERDLDVVMRTQALLYVDQNSDSVVDITQEVAEGLGISLDQAPGEPSPSVQPTPNTPPAGGGQ
jgi:outer membrane protein